MTAEYTAPTITELELETFGEMLIARKAWQNVDNYKEEIVEFETKLEAAKG